MLPGYYMETPRPEEGLRWQISSIHNLTLSSDKGQLELKSQWAYSSQVSLLSVCVTMVLSSQSCGHYEVN